MGQKPARGLARLLQRRASKRGQSYEKDTQAEEMPFGRVIPANRKEPNLVTSFGSRLANEQTIHWGRDAGSSDRLE